MNSEITDLEKADQLGMFDLFALFYEEQNGAPMSEEQCAYMQDLIEKFEEENV